MPIYCTCPDWQRDMLVLEAQQAFCALTIRAPKWTQRNKTFVFCPWCGEKLKTANFAIGRERGSLFICQTCENQDPYSGAFRCLISVRDEVHMPENCPKMRAAETYSFLSDETIKEEICVSE